MPSKAITLPLFIAVVFCFINLQYENSLMTPSASSIYDNDMLFSEPKLSFYDVSDAKETSPLPAWNVQSVIIAGAQKGGTTAVFRYLQGHPQVQNNGGPRKREMHFFDRQVKSMKMQSKFRRRSRDGSYHPQDVEAVLKHYQSFWNITDPNVKVALEKTPSYMISPHVIGGIKSIVPRAKIIMVLRDPIDRAVSQFTMDKTKANGSLSNTTVSECVEMDLRRLEAAGIRGCAAHMSRSDHDHCWDELDRAWTQYMEILEHGMLDLETRSTTYYNCGSMVGRGLYALQLRVWWKHYNKKERDDLFLIMDSESLKPDESSGMIDLRLLTDFLGISEMSVNGTKKGIHSSKFIKDYRKKQFNITYGGEDDPLTLSDTTREKLRRFYEPFNAELKAMLGEEWEQTW